eukprot:COSAG01_NODE_36368_length_518_cov_13.615883_1_plen_96_part_10
MAQKGEAGVGQNVSNRNCGLALMHSASNKAEHFGTRMWFDTSESRIEETHTRAHAYNPCLSSEAQSNRRGCRDSGPCLAQRPIVVNGERYNRVAVL